MTARQGGLSIAAGAALLSTTLLGTGIFIIPALGLIRGGDQALFAWPLLLLMMLPVAWVFGDLGSQHPHAGGVSYWARNAFGARAEWTVALLFLAVVPVGLPAALDIAMLFLKPYMPDNTWVLLLCKLCLLSAVYGMNRLGLKASAWIQGGIGLIIMLFVLYLNSNTSISGLMPPAVSTIDGSIVLSLLATLLWCFLGIEIVANLAEEFERPGQLLVATLISLLVASIIYYLATAAIWSDINEVTPDSLMRLSTLKLGPIGGVMLNIFGALACFASMNTYFSGFSRQILSLFKQSNPNSQIGRYNTAGVPVHALNLLFICCLFFTVLFHFDWIDLENLIRLANSNFVLVYLAAMLSGFLLLKGLSRWIALIAAGFFAALLGGLGLEALYGLILAAIFWLSPRPQERA